MKKLLIILGVLSVIIVSAFVFEDQLDKTTDKIKEQALMKEQEALEKQLAEERAFKARLKNKADNALLYSKKKGFDLNHAFLVDFSIHSGKNRFFVWDYKKDTVIHSSLCAHGTGTDNNRSTYTDIKYSNKEGSYCSSLGKYKIGARSYSKWGINVHYKMHGLEPTNDNAFKRIVVLHSYELVPETETYPRHLPLGYSLGCPVINDFVMKKVDDLLKTKDKPVLLWIYN